mmetsp:Transcript_4368/g.5644  ORF Transcript_4368/g.5644 Transcript_4368/m.5644 type:complete len:105 (+) Transcript_4368:455-769(+)
MERSRYYIVTTPYDTGDYPHRGWSSLQASLTVFNGLELIFYLIFKNEERYTTVEELCPDGVVECVNRRMFDQAFAKQGYSLCSGFDQSLEEEGSQLCSICLKNS